MVQRRKLAIRKTEKTSKMGQGRLKLPQNVVIRAYSLLDYMYFFCLCVDACVRPFVCESSTVPVMLTLACVFEVFKKDFIPSLLL